MHSSMLNSEASRRLTTRHQSFWRREPAERPLVGQPLRESVFPLQNLIAGFAEGVVTPENIRAQDFLPAHHHTSIVQDGGDLVNTEWAMPALPWTEAMAGCPVEVVFESGTTWAGLACPPAMPLASFRPALRQAWLDKLIECTRALVADANGRYAVATTLMRGPMDMLAAMIGTQRMCLAMVDEPAEIERLLDFCTTLWIQAAQAQLACIPPIAGGYVNRYKVWAPGTSVVTQADISNLISPRQYKKFLLPCDARIGATFDYLTLHSHSAGQTQLDLMLGLDELDCIEIAVDHLGPTFFELIPLFKKILERKPLVLMNTFEDETQAALEQLPAAGLCVIPRP